MTVNFSAEELVFLENLVTNKVKSIASGKEITDLGTTTKIESGDLLLVRKTQSNEDKAINYNNLLTSIGNTAIDGFVAAKVNDSDNAVKLTSANLVKVDKYYNGMKVSFISPIKNDGQYQIQVDTLALKPLYAYKTTTTAVIDINDYIEAVYIADDDAFYQVNKNNLVYTNDYVYETHEYGVGDQYTNIFLSSAFGARKTQYYKGMTINFICPIDTKGFVRINIDGLGVKDILEGDVDDLIYTPLWSGQHIQATYDGVAFKHNEYLRSDPKLGYALPNEIIESEEEVQISETEIIKVPVIQVLPNPKNTIEFTVGASNSNKFATLKEAIDSCIKEFGIDGGGRSVTLKVTDTIYVDTETKYNANKWNIDKDLSWITIVGLNSTIIIDYGSYRAPHGTLFSLAYDGKIKFAGNTTFKLIASQRVISQPFSFTSLTYDSEIFKNCTFVVSANFKLILYIKTYKNCVLDGLNVTYDYTGNVDNQQKIFISFSTHPWTGYLKISNSSIDMKSPNNTSNSICLEFNDYGTLEINKTSFLGYTEAALYCYQNERYATRSKEVLELSCSDSKFTTDTQSTTVGKGYGVIFNTKGTFTQERTKSTIWLLNTAVTESKTVSKSIPHPDQNNTFVTIQAKYTLIGSQT